MVFGPTQHEILAGEGIDNNHRGQDMEIGMGHREVHA